MNWPRYIGFRIQKVGMFKIKLPNDAEYSYLYQEADHENKWQGQEAIEVSWEVRGIYNHINDLGDNIPVVEPICNCTDMTRADMVLLALRDRHERFFPDNYK